jgi:hypothetical protein
MKLKQAILTIMGRDTLKAVVDDLGIEGVDRRRVEDMRAQVSRSRRAEVELLLAHLSEKQVKAVCEGLGVNSTGRRRELAYFHIHYAYKAEVVDDKTDPQRIGIEEAAQALSLFKNDPRYVVWLKKELARLLDTGTDQYKELFPSTLSAIQLANAVRFLRYVQSRTTVEGRGVGAERLSYRHGIHAIGWVLAKRIIKEQQDAKLLDDAKLKNILVVPFDELRQIHWTETQRRLHLKGPLALFRNQTDTIPLLESILIAYYGLGADPALRHKRSQHVAGSPYPKALFDYLISRAPQIGNLS